MEAKEQNQRSEQGKTNSKEHNLLRKRKHYTRSGWICLLLLIVSSVIIGYFRVSGVISEVLPILLFGGVVVCYVAGSNAKGEYNKIQYLKNKKKKS